MAAEHLAAAQLAAAQMAAALLRAVETCAGLTEIRIVEDAAISQGVAKIAPVRKKKLRVLTAEERAAAAAAAAEAAAAARRDQIEDQILQAEAQELERERLYRMAESTLTRFQSNEQEAEALRIRNLLLQQKSLGRRDADRLTSKVMAAGVEAEMLTILEAVSTAPRHRWSDAPAVPTAPSTAMMAYSAAPAAISSSRRRSGSSASALLIADDGERWPACMSSTAASQAERTRRAKQALDARAVRKSVVQPLFTTPGGSGTRDRIMSRGF